MVELRYALIERQLVETLPEVRPAYDRYWDRHGPPGMHAGQYAIFEGVFTKYVEVLLALPAGPSRDRLLARALAFVEEMLTSADGDVRDLAFIGLYEGRESWWYGRALPFLGSASRAALDEKAALRARGWLAAGTSTARPDPDRPIIDLYGVREVVWRLLRGDGIERAQVPGISAPMSWEALVSLEAARHDPEGVVILSCFGTSRPYVIGPASLVACDEGALIRLARDLAVREQREPNQREKAGVFFFRIPLGERVWNMDTAETEHGRYRGGLWIREALRVALGPQIRQVLAGERPRLTDLP